MNDYPLAFELSRVHNQHRRKLSAQSAGWRKPRRLWFDGYGAFHGVASSLQGCPLGRYSVPFCPDRDVSPAEMLRMLCLEAVDVLPGVDNPQGDGMPLWLGELADAALKSFAL